MPIQVTSFDSFTSAFRFIEKGREMGAETDHDLWEDDAFLNRVQEALQKDGILLRLKKNT